MSIKNFQLVGKDYAYGGTNRLIKSEECSGMIGRQKGLKERAKNLTVKMSTSVPREESLRQITQESE